MNIHSARGGGDQTIKTSDKRYDIMQSALELLVEQGFHGAPMAAIAEKAGVAAGTIYRYFSSKDALINELYRELRDQITAILKEDYPSESPVRERFLYLIGTLIRYFVKNPLHFRYMEQYFNSPYGILMHRDKILGKSGENDMLMDVFDKGIEQKVFKALPKTMLFSLACGPLVLLIRDHIFGLIELDEGLIDQATEACWDAIKGNSGALSIG